MITLMEGKRVKILDELRFDERGLIPAIIQDAENGQVLMLGYMNREALQRTIQSRRVCFWSRSRRTFWIKGETSGHTQEVKAMYFDCEENALLIQVEQKVAACHQGYRSCFFRRITTDGNGIEVVGERVFDPDRVYAQSVGEEHARTP